MTFVVSKKLLLQSSALDSIVCRIPLSTGSVNGDSVQEYLKNSVNRCESVSKKSNAAGNLIHSMKFFKIPYEKTRESPAGVDL